MYPSDTLADPTPTLPVLVGSVGITRQCTMRGEVYPPSVFFSPPVRPLSCARLRILPGPCVFSRAPDPRTEHFYAHFCLPHHDARDGHRPCPGDLRHDRDGLLRFRPSIGLANIGGHWRVGGRGGGRESFAIIHHSSCCGGGAASVSRRVAWPTRGPSRRSKTASTRTNALIHGQEAGHGPQARKGFNQQR